MKTSHARKYHAGNSAKPSPSVVSVCCCVILTGTPPYGLGFFSLHTGKNLRDVSNTEFARGVARWQMKWEQCYRVYVVFITVTTAEDFLYKEKTCIHRLQKEVAAIMLSRVYFLKGFCLHFSEM